MTVEPNMDTSERQGLLASATGDQVAARASEIVIDGPLPLVRPPEPVPEDRDRTAALRRRATLES